MPEVRPFPWGALPAWRRRETVDVRRMVRHLEPCVPADLLGTGWHPLVRGPLSAVPGRPGAASGETLQARHAGTVVAAMLRHATLGGVAALIDRPWALGLAARVLGADEEGVRRTASAGVFTAAHEGALGVLVSQVAVRALAPSPPPVLRGVSERLEDVLATLEGDLLAWPWRLTVGGESGDVVLVLSARAAFRDAGPARPDVERLGAVRLPLAVEAAYETLPAREVASWRTDDVLVLESISRGEGRWSGSVRLALGGAVVVPAGLEDGRTLRITGAAEARGRSDVDGTDDRATAVRTEVLAGLPVEVTVEIARGSVTVAEVGAWRVGEVVRFAEPVGTCVTVRAGGRPVARGHLVDVEGEVGVQLTELL